MDNPLLTRRFRFCRFHLCGGEQPPPPRRRLYECPKTGRTLSRNPVPGSAGVSGGAKVDHGSGGISRQRAE